MNLKYPKLKSALNLIYISIWLGIAGKMFAKAFVYTEKILEITFFSEWLELFVAIVVSVVITIGVYIASKEEKKYRTIFYVALVESILNFAYGVVYICEMHLFVLVFGLAIMIAFLLRIWLFCLATAKILSEEGDVSVAKKGKWVGICYSIVYGHSIAAVFFALINNAGVLGAGVAIIVSIATIAGWILYVVFIKQAMEFFENLTVEAGREE